MVEEKCDYTIVLTTKQELTRHKLKLSLNFGANLKK